MLLMVARSGQAGVTSMPAAAPRDKRSSSKGKTHKATAGQGLGAENLALTSAVPSPLII